MQIEDDKIFSLFYWGGGQLLHAFGIVEAWIFTCHYKKCLLTGKKIKITNQDINLFFQSRPLIDQTGRVNVYHLYYELGVYYLWNEIFFDDPEETPLFIFLSYSNSLLQDFQFYKNKIELREVNDSQKMKESYLDSFYQGQEHLHAGNCYQYNLTQEFKYQCSEKETKGTHIIENLFSSEQKLGAYAHATHLPSLGQTLISNSPESLFEAKLKGDEIKITSAPIKGSANFVSDDEVDFLWDQLSRCAKNQAELFMITDLVKNDLTKISNNSTTVLAKKEKLIVPGIVHQYSLLQTLANKDLSLYRVLKSLFPGGSITGAPKKRVVQIIASLEKRRRGFYCGSTILQKDHFCSASINIRSGHFEHQLKLLEFGAGGGITVQSRAEDEFQEMLGKVQSYMSLF